MSVFRIVLIPFIAWLYVGKQKYAAALVLLILSGATDVADGWIARHFNMVSDFGKALDPVADKLTQGIVLICLSTKFPLMIVMILLLVAKESVIGISQLIMIRRTGEVYGAKWHGKINTVMIYLTMGVHMIWINIPQGLSRGMILCSSALTVLSFVLYWLEIAQRRREYKIRQKAGDESNV